MSEVVPKLGSRALFPDLQPPVYLNFAGASPPNMLAREAVDEVMRDYAQRGVAAMIEWAERRNTLRHDIAALIHAPAPDDTIAFVPSTTSGVIACAQSIAWKRGDRVVLFRGEFPANVTPWQQAARHYGLELVWLDERDLVFGDGLSLLESVLKEGARLVAVSAVCFQTGWRLPIEAVGALCARYDAELFVDAIQGCGVVPLDVQRIGASYMACGGHKWLMGIEGAGFLYVSPQALERSLSSRLAGWTSHEDPFAFLTQGAGHLRYDRPIRQQASLLEGGALATVGYAALQRSIGVLQGLGIEAIFDYVSGYLDQLEAELVERFGMVSTRAKDRAAQSGILSISSWPGFDLMAVAPELASRGVMASTPDGHLRFGAHWPNDAREIALVVEALDEIRVHLG